MVEKGIRDRTDTSERMPESSRDFLYSAWNRASIRRAVILVLLLAGFSIFPMAFSPVDDASATCCPDIFIDTDDTNPPIGSNLGAGKEYTFDYLVEYGLADGKSGTIELYHPETRGLFATRNVTGTGSNERVTITVTETVPSSLTGDNFAVSYILRDSNGDIEEFDDDIYPVVDPTPTADFSFSPSSPTIQDTINFDGTLSSDDEVDGSISSYSWDFDDGNSATGSNPSHQYSSTGTYTVSLTVTDNDGNTDTVNKDVTVSNSPPTADFSFSPSSPNTKDTIDFTDESADSDGTIQSWSWDFGDGTTSTQENPSHSYSSSGTFTVSLTVTDDGGNEDTITKDVTVSNSPPTADFSFIPSNPTTGDTIDFTDGSTDNDGNIQSWFWKFGDGTTSTQENPSHSYSSSGTYTVNLTVTDNDGLKDSEQKTVDVSGPANFDVSIDSTNSPVVEGENVTFTYTVTNTGGTKDTQTIVGRTPDLPPSDPRQRESGPLTLDAGESITIPVETPTGEGDAGEYEVILETENDTATTSVTVLDSGGGGNTPPTASFTASPSNPSTSDTVTFDASGSSDSDGSIQSYEWDFDDGTTTTGELPSHSYSSSGDYAVTLTVTDNDGATDTTTNTIFVSDPEGGDEDPANFAVRIDRTDSPVTEGNTITIDAVITNTGGESDSQTIQANIPGVGSDSASVNLDGGSSTTETFSIPTSGGDRGDYTLTVSSDDTSDSIDVTVQSDDAKVDVTEVDPLLEGATIEGLDVENKYNIRVDTDGTVDSVALELGGKTYDAQQTGGNTWQVAADLSGLSSDTIGTITAETTDGTTDSRNFRVGVQETPEWTAWILNNNINTNPDPDWSTGLNSKNYVFERGYVIFGNVQKSANIGSGGKVNIPIPWSNPFNFDHNVVARVGLTAPEGNMVLGLGGGADVELLSIDDVEVTVNGDASLDQNNRISRAAVDINGKAEGIPTPWGLSIDLSSLFGAGPEIGVGVTANVEIGGGTEFGRGMVLQEGRVDPAKGGLFVGSSGSAGPFSYEVGGEGSVDGSAEFDIDPAKLTGLDVGTRLGVVTKASAPLLEIGGELTLFDLSYSLVGSGTQTVSIRKLDEENVEVKTTGWQVQSKRGENPVPDVPSVDEPVGTLSTDSPIYIAGVGQERLTNRGLEDTQPAIEDTSDEKFVVWSRQLEDHSPKEGTDIAYRMKNGGSWSSASTITDDSKDDGRPDVAGNSDLLAAWARVDKSFAGARSISPNEVFNNQEIAFSRYNNQTENWETLNLITKNGIPDYSPTVAYSDAQDAWLVAWERDSNIQTSGVGDLSVQYAIVDDTGVVAESSIQNGASPDVGVGSNGDLKLAYYEPQNGRETGDVVVGSVNMNGVFSEDRSRSTTKFTDLATDGDELAYVDGSVQDPNLNYDDGSGSPMQLSLSTDMTSMDGLKLQVNADSTVLAYRGVPQGQRGQDVIYRVARDGEWIADRPIADSLEGDLNVWHPDMTINEDGDGFSLAYASEKFDLKKDTVNDIFVASREFAPDYDVDATGPTDASVGDTVNIDYGARNVGGADDVSSVEVKLLSGGQTIDTQTIGPVGAGEKIEGTFTAQLDETGTFTVAVDRGSTSSEWLSNKEEVRIAAPLLGVSGVSAERPASDRAVVNVTLANSGGAGASNVPVGITNGTSTIGSTTTTSVPANGEASAEVTIDPDNINRGTPGEVVIDAQRTLPEGFVDNRKRTLFLLRPNLAITNSTFNKGNNSTVVKVENRGTAEAEATVSVVKAQDGTSTGVVLGSTEIDIPAAVGGSPSEKTAVVKLSGANASQDVLISADTVVPDPDVTETAVLDEVPFSVEDSCPMDPVVCNYDPNGDINTADLQAAINDFIQDPDVDTGDLQAVINAFISS